MHGQQQGNCQPGMELGRGEDGGQQVEGVVEGGGHERVVLATGGVALDGGGAQQLRFASSASASPNAHPVLHQSMTALRCVEEEEAEEVLGAVRRRLQSRPSGVQRCACGRSGEDGQQCGRLEGGEGGVEVRVD